MCRYTKRVANESCHVAGSVHVHGPSATLCVAGDLRGYRAGDSERIGDIEEGDTPIPVTHKTVSTVTENTRNVVTRDVPAVVDADAVLLGERLRDIEDSDFSALVAQ